MAAKKKLPSVTIEGARIIFRNFAGRPGPYNAAGVRSFAVLLDEETAETLLADDWNVKYLKPREEDDVPAPYLPVKVNFDSGRPPRIVMVTSNGRQPLDHTTVEMLDFADISTVDVVINPSAWDINGKQGISAYLKTLFVVVEEDELEKKYAINELEN